jgi:hypothetical protein
VPSASVLGRWGPSASPPASWSPVHGDDGNEYFGPYAFRRLRALRVRPALLCHLTGDEGTRGPEGGSGLGARAGVRTPNHPRRPCPPMVAARGARTTHRARE